MQLNPENLNELTLRVPGSLHIESVIYLEDIIKMLIPTETVDVLKVIKVIHAAQLENFKCPGHSLHMTAAAKKLVKGIDNEKHVESCLSCKWYPYSIVCEDIALDFVAEGFLSFKYLSHGLDQLIQNKKLAKRLGSRISIVDQ